MKDKTWISDQQGYILQLKSHIFGTVNKVFTQ